MNILHLNLLLLFINGLIYILLSKYKRVGIFFLLLILIQFIVINSIRFYTVGTDTSVYYTRFLHAQQLGALSSIISLQRFEPGYAILQYIVTLFTDNFNTLLFVTAIIIYLPLVTFIKRYSQNYFISTFLFITLRHFDFSLSGIRQAIAISIGLYAFHYASNKKIEKFIFIVLLAASFHYSALILLPLYFIVNLEPKPVHLLFLGSIFGIFFIFKDAIGRILVSLYFTDSTSFVNYSEGESIGLFGVLLLLIIMVGIFFNNPFDNNTDKLSKSMYNISIVSFFIHMISTYSYYFKRLNMYYAIFTIIYLSLIFKNELTTIIKFPKRDLKIIQIFAGAFIVGVLSIYYLQIIELDLYELIPYITSSH